MASTFATVFYPVDTRVPAESLGAVVAGFSLRCGLSQAKACDDERPPRYPSSSQVSFQQIGHDFRPRHAGVGQAIVATFVREREPRVVEAQGVEQRRVKIANADDVVHGPIAEVVRLAMDMAAFEAAAGQP